MRQLPGFRTPSPRPPDICRRQFSRRVLAAAQAAALLVSTLAITLLPSSTATAALGDITTVAGGGIDGDTGPATIATFAEPSSLAFDDEGNTYIADTSNHRIRKVDTSGIVTTVAGNGEWGGGGDDEAATNAQLAFPLGVAVHTDDNGDTSIYIADFYNFRIRKVDNHGTITTVAGNGDYGYDGDGNAATEAQLGGPTGVAFDDNGNMYIADSGSHRIRMVDPDGKITTVAGNGDYGYDGDGNAATEAQLAYPTGVAFDDNGNMYIADSGSHRIRMVDPDGKITTVAGNGERGDGGDDGLAIEAQLAYPNGVAVHTDLDGDTTIYIADSGNDLIRKVGPDGKITTVAGGGDSWGYDPADEGKSATDIALSYPSGVALHTTDDGKTTIYIADSNHGRIRKVDASGIITTVAGGTDRYTGDQGQATTARLASPSGVAFDDNGNMYIADTKNHRVRKVSTSGTITTFAGNGNRGYTDGDDGKRATDVALSEPNGVAVHTDLNGDTTIYIADSGNDLIRKVGPDGKITTVAGGGDSWGYDPADEGKSATDIALSYPSGVALHTTDDGKTTIYIADSSNNLIRKVDATGTITTIAGRGGWGDGGDNGAATEAQLAYPTGLAVHTDDNGDTSIYIADTLNNRIRKVGPDGVISTVAGIAPTTEESITGEGAAASATNTALNMPFGVAINDEGSLFIADTYNHRIRKVDNDGTITTIAGIDENGFGGDGGPAVDAVLAYPAGVAVGNNGNLYIADSSNNRIRKIMLSAAPPTTPTTTTPTTTTTPPPPPPPPPPPVAQEGPVPTPPVGFTASSPSRLFDTRPGEPAGMITVAKQAVAGGSVLEVQVAGKAGMPATGVGSVALSVTATQATANAYITVYPCGTRPLASNLNYTAGQTIANTVITPVDANGKVCFYAHGTTHLFADLTGWFPASSAMTSMTPTRMFDTRPSEPAGAVTVAKQAVTGGSVLEVQVAGKAGMPTSGIGSVALTVTATEASANGYITVYPCGTRPLASNLNYTAGQTIANTVITPVDTNGNVCFYAHGTTHLLADVTGWFPTGQSPATTSPSRLFDTRPGEPAGAVTVTKQAVTGGSVLEVQVAGKAGMPATGIGSVALTVTATEATTNGYITVYPCGTRPLASNLNYTAGQTIANTVITPVDANGKVCLYAHGTTHLLADVTGWFPTTTS